jgi:hypothetical protein
MKAGERTFQQVLHGPDQYVIPVFQRFYTWGQKNWEQLWDDLSALFEEGTDATSRHFMGAVVCVPEMHLPGVVPAYQVIDGQQRLTTLSLLLCAMRDAAKTKGWEELAAEIEENYLIHRFKKDRERYKLFPRLRDRAAYLSIVDSKERQSDSQIYLAHTYHLEQLQERLLLVSELKLREFFMGITTRLDFVAITLGAESPYKIFKSLNSTGVDLGQGDLIRNHTFMVLSVSEQDRFDDEEWRPLERHFESAGKLDGGQLAAFFRDVMMRSGEYIGENAIYETFEKRFKLGHFNPVEVAKEMRAQARRYDWIRGKENHPTQAVNQALRAIRGLQVTATYPLLLALLEAREVGRMSDDELTRALKAVSSFLLRRYVCGDGSRAYSRWFCSICRELGPKPLDGVLNFFKIKGWPGDDRFLPAFQRMNLYGSKYAREVLTSLERAIQAASEPVSLDKCTIEHVMPQSIEPSDDEGAAWVEMLGPEWQRLRGIWQDTPGNLTLVGEDYNREMSNHRFSNKRPVLAASKVYLNHHFTTAVEWNEKAISARGEKLAKRAAMVWPGFAELASSQP